MKERILSALTPALGLALVAAAFWILHRELAHYHLRDVAEHFHAIPGRAVAASLILTAVGYVALTGYDTLSFRYLRLPLAYPRIALASFIGYVFSHNVGLSFFGGSAVRYRILTSYGVRPGEIARVIAVNVLTFWLGFLTLGGAVLALDPAPMPAALRAHLATTRPIGSALLAVLAAYLVVSLVRRAPLATHGFEIPVPPLRVTALQIAVSSVDWALAAAALYVLLPGTADLSFASFLGVYLLAVILGVVSNVPAGLGVFESALVVLLSPRLPGDAVLASIFAYRIVYYLVPMAVAVLLFVGFELAQRRRHLERAQALVVRWAPAVVPRLVAAGTALCGGVLLASGATPAAPGRLAALARVLPLSVIELSHFLGSVVGAGLLLLARALHQRLDAAYYLTLALLAAGAALMLGKGLDWEEAVLLTATFAALLPCRSFFYRQSSLLGRAFSRDWALTLLVALLGTAVLTALAHRHVDYARELWWRFELEGQAPRSLRALAGAAAVLLVGALARLLRPAPPDLAGPTADDLERARVIAANAPQASAHLALLGDKRLLFHEDGNAFVMYAIHRRTWVAMGDPSGAVEQRRELAWRFLELADRYRGRAVFYEVGSRDLPLYVDLGLSLRKLGEEARVPLASFSLEGGARKSLRQAQNRMAREGCAFEILPAQAVPAVLDELEEISQAWLAEKHTREKRFSLGFFDRRYLALLPVAVVRRHGRIVAFANVWAGGAKEELSLDLMRHRADLPPGGMEYLFAELMLWGQAQGYRWFSLGMAPLSGLKQHRLAPLWNRIGALLFRHGEHFYNFQGLRAFKDKFRPVWEPRFLAHPGGLPAPLVLAQVAALISGGAAGVIAR